MAKSKRQEFKSLARYIIDKTDTNTYRAGNLVGWKHLNVSTELMESVGGRKSLLEQAHFLEESTEVGRNGKIKIDWCQVKSDIKTIHYEISSIPELCKLERVEDTRQHQLELIAIVEHWRADIQEYPWLCRYYDDILNKLLKGSRFRDEEDERYFRCINEIAKIKEPIWERVFSARVLRDSKVHYTYGTVINTQTMEHSRPFAISGCRRIMTIENKANYESMPYEKDVLYIFCHGYLTPKEVRFLKQLCMIVPKDCEFYHWGDMDFGRISIFQFIKEKVFPDLKPYRMDVKDFEEALANGAGIPMKDSTREKLERKEAGVLTELKAEILRTGMTIEQERLL
jgi:hypothetical protein